MIIQLRIKHILSKLSKVTLQNTNGPMSNVVGTCGTPQDWTRACPTNRLQASKSPSSPFALRTMASRLPAGDYEEPDLASGLCVAFSQHEGAPPLGLVITKERTSKNYVVSTSSKSTLLQCEDRAKLGPKVSCLSLSPLTLGS